MRGRPLDFASLAAVGSLLGSAGVVVLAAGVDMREAALVQLRFFEAESCGQCAPCRIGTRYLRESLDRGLAEPAGGALAERVEDVAWQMREGSICGLGQFAHATSDERLEALSRGVRRERASEGIRQRTMPCRASGSTVASVDFRAGETVLDVAARAGIEIPTLCHDPRLDPAGACRTCLVEVEGGVAPGAGLRDAAREAGMAFDTASASASTGIASSLLRPLPDRPSRRAGRRGRPTSYLRYAQRYDARELRLGPHGERARHAASWIATPTWASMPSAASCARAAPATATRSRA